MKDCGAVLLVLLVLTLGFDRVNGWPYGTTVRTALHVAGVWLRGV